MLTDEQVISLVERELLEQTMGATEQFLAIHSPVLVEGKPKVDRIDREREGRIVVYLPVLEQQFYFTFYINAEKGEITGMDTEAWQRVYFRATSETMSADDLKAMTRLMVTNWWSKGDLKWNGRSAHKYSNIEILSNPEPDAFEDKLKKLLDYLLEDAEGIRHLVRQAKGYIQVATDFHFGNGMLGGPFLSAEAIQKMAALGLSISFDLYVWGEPFREE
ncbi:DUF4279 domain-containing protein [Paraflavitalea sp. CAU 1676]|uniref:DUF4279 domain-containing protein n=1 Tax=Paraflavitalea sp. CAU 1676 TaxID=3032598 RepID=UPI0023DBE506|nr:DUF4279 domain-containing protein [Paraflavitalea sp. CAU 1676]MDF2192734.1 DUF4279 domain-containing protein [Paraflavitalea sp. CAU 1676]